MSKFEPIVGEPLCDHRPNMRPGATAVVVTDMPLAPARSTARLTCHCSAEQLGRLGGTIYQLRGLEATIEGGPMVPKSVLNQLRRELVARARRAWQPPTGTRDRGRARPCRRCWSRSWPSDIARRDACAEPAADRAVGPVPHDRADRSGPGAGCLHDLCRLPGHQAIRRGRREAVRRWRVTAESTWRHRASRSRARRASLRHLAQQGADGMLVRNAGGLRYCAEHGVPFVADFSLNAANPLTVELFKSRGALRVTASYDLNVEPAF